MISIIFLFHVQQNEQVKYNVKIPLEEASVSFPLLSDKHFIKPNFPVMAKKEKGKKIFHHHMKSAEIIQRYINYMATFVNSFIVVAVNTQYKRGEHKNVLTT